ncbi:hypothetical protein KAH81_04700 [bacterium]|nr:hypothetical protein [bacterium]
MNDNTNTINDDALVEQLQANPEDIKKLIIAKRKANAEAREYREKLEETTKMESEQENLSTKIAELENLRLRDNFCIEAMRANIRPERLDAAFKIAQFDESDEDPSKIAIDVISQLKDGFPELFQEMLPPPRVDNAGFSRSKGDELTLARAAGDTLSMLKALR